MTGEPTKPNAPSVPKLGYGRKSRRRPSIVTGVTFMLVSAGLLLLGGYIVVVFAFFAPPENRRGMLHLLVFGCLMLASAITCGWYGIRAIRGRVYTP